MAMQVQFRCDHCDHVVEAWDDGNPYFLDEDGSKHHAWHPSDELALCIGNDSPHLCLDCARDWMRDSRAPRDDCPHCGSSKIADLMSLGGCPCPWCRAGTFHQRPGFVAIS